MPGFVGRWLKVRDYVLNKRLLCEAERKKAEPVTKISFWEEDCSVRDLTLNSLRIVDNEGFIVFVEFTGLHSQEKSNNIRSWLYELALFALPSQPGKPGPWDCDAGIPVNRTGNFLRNNVGAGDPDQQLDSG